MKYSLFFAISLAALSVAGCKKEAVPVSEPTGAADAVDASLPEVASEAVGPGQTFANAAAASDAFEIETSKLADSKSQSTKIKAFAEHMIKAHTDSTAKLKAAAASATPAITPVPDLTPVQQQTLADLGAKSGADFDRAYAKALTDAHQMTLDTLKAYSASGDVPALKTFAGELVPIVTAHLNTAKGL